MERKESDPIAFADSLTMPCPVKESTRVYDKCEGSSCDPDERILRDQIAPYQAIPATGTIINHLAKEQPVLAFKDDEDRKKAIEVVIKEYAEQLQVKTDTHMGYPYNLNFDYGALDVLRNFSINNLGDPWIESNYGVHSRQFELGVLHWFAKLWEIENYWGYITNCGTEGNLHGILVARENLPDGVLYASAESHYSVFKAARMYRMEAEKIDTLVTGEIDYEKLKVALGKNSGKKAAIINVNIGTTVKGAIDDLDIIIDILYKCGYTEDTFYIHCDGALFGMMIPFIKESPLVSFKKPIGSVSVSGHKFMGCPMPCGIVITRTKYIEALSNDIEYLNSRDATIMGSRNGHAPIYMWYTITTKGYSGFCEDVRNCLKNAHLLHSMLFAAGIRTMLNERSSTVVFERPKNEDFVRKWQLACQGDIAHVVVMPNVTKEKITLFVNELKAVK